MLRLVSVAVAVFMLLFLMSCSNGGENIVTPEDENRDVLEYAGGTNIQGLWQFTADKATGDASFIQLRTADQIMNVIGFMEPPPLTLMDLDWPNLNIDFDNGLIDVGVILEHPLGGDPTFTGFDVRGVCFGPKVLNADGATIIPSPEFFTGVPFGYQDGLVGTPDGGVGFTGPAGYKYFCNGIGASTDLVTFFSSESNLNNRGNFIGTAPHQRNYNLSYAGTGYDFLVFNYAIYANFDWPVGSPPFTVNSFDISTANSSEAFCGTVYNVDNTLYYSTATSTGGGSISLDLEVWDWQNNIMEARVESVLPGIVPPVAETSFVAGTTSKSVIYSFSSVPGVPTSNDDLDILVSAVDPKTWGDAWFMGLLPSGHAKYAENAYNSWIYTAEVVDCPGVVYSTSFDASDPDEPNWQHTAIYWSCNWFTGSINSNNGTCANYGATGGTWYAWRTAGFTVPACWSGPITLSSTHSWTRDFSEYGCYDRAGVQYSLNNSYWQTLAFPASPYDYACTNPSGWTASFTSRTDTADLSTVVNPGDTVWIRYLVYTGDSLYNGGAGFTITEMNIG